MTRKRRQTTPFIVFLLRRKIVSFCVFKDSDFVFTQLIGMLFLMFLERMIGIGKASLFRYMLCPIELHFPSAFCILVPTAPFEKMQYIPESKPN